MIFKDVNIRKKNIAYKSKQVCEQKRTYKESFFFFLLTAKSYKMDPSQRLKDLVAKANDFDVDAKISAAKYLRSSREMERMVVFSFFFLMRKALFHWKYISSFSLVHQALDYVLLTFTSFHLNKFLSLTLQLFTFFLVLFSRVKELLEFLLSKEKVP